MSQEREDKNNKIKLNALKYQFQYSKCIQYICQMF